MWRKTAFTWLLVGSLALTGQTTRTGRRPLITRKIDESKLHALAGNTRSQATAENDRGRAADSLAMEHMLLQLRRAPEQEQAVQQLIDSQHDPKSANYHKWMTPEQFGQTYGAAQQDIDTVTAWLAAQGFTVNSVAPNRMLIDFSGTAGQVRAAFHTEIHHLSVNGAPHTANLSDPMIPEALAPAVAGIVSLHDFTPHSMARRHSDYTFGSRNNVQQAMVPGDLAAIYNLNPLFSSGITGKGQTIAVIEDTDLYDPADWSTFRTAFGLDAYSAGTLTTVQPGGCRDPGVLGGDDSEAALDAEWAAAAAPDATIQVTSCANTRSTWGGLIALQNLVNSPNPPAIVSISYGDCEADNGATANAAFNLVYQQAVAEGISIFVASGDEGAAACDSGATAATHGIAVSGWASTPYNVAVGGTDFSDSYNNTNGTYWTSTNSPTYTSAVSYIPEIPWNSSCASMLIAGLSGFTTTYGADGFCGSTAARQGNLIDVAASSGGPSGCATGAPSTSLVVSGTCQGYAKPSWQTGLPGIPNDGVRDLPDVSLFAGDGVWGHFYVTCFSDRRNGGASCAGAPSTWAGAGGTSFSAPILAGIQALVNQRTGSRQGNPNYVYYSLAANPAAVCNATADDDGGNCIFHNVTQGDSAVNCGGTQNCFGVSNATTGGIGGRRGGNPLGTNGALSLTNDSYTPAYGTGAGWNFTTGIGSINAYNLVTNWPGQ